jgi:hypothetical protein
VVVFSKFCSFFAAMKQYPLFLTGCNKSSIDTSDTDLHKISVTLLSTRKLAFPAVLQFSFY